MDAYQTISRFSTDNIQQATLGLLAYLGISTDVITHEQISVTDLIEQPSKMIKDICSKIDESYLVCSISDRTFQNNAEKETMDEIRINLGKYEQLLVFAIDFREDARITRTEMANLTRALNRASKSSPVVMVCRYYDNGIIRFALSLCERTAYKQTGHTGEKVGKVNILRGINPKKTHTGHIRILESMRLEKKTHTFEAVYTQWLNVFDNDVLTNQFYKELQNWYFWALKPECKVSFPNDINDDEDDKKYNPQNLIRLITRLIFVWFLRQKGLVPKELFDVEDLQRIIKDFDPDDFGSNTYYRAILQNLFFATLNKKIEERDFVSDNFLINRNQGRHKIKTFMRHASDLKVTKEEFIQLMRPVPFMNNSLFECLDNKKQNDHIYNWDGFSESNKPDRQAFIPNYLFFAKEVYIDLSKEYDRASASSVKVSGLLNILKRYNFTVEENTPLDQDVALDPELLGKVFENLLAAYNPETKETVRKSTGSYYTPRPIVQYMVDESLVAYLKKSVPDVSEDVIRSLLSYNNDEQATLLNKEQAHDMAEALLNCKVLDPACGSGAFPMGMLQQMSHLLSRVDADNKLWEKVVMNRALNDASFVERVSDEEKEAHKHEIEEVFTLSTEYPDYARKLYLIENCIYGVDLQSIAVQISRLRFFISLLCEQQPDLTVPEKNYNIKPLPNLEMKFVCANTLVGLENIDKTRELFSNREILSLIDELKAIRHELFIVTDQHVKEKLLSKDEALRNKIMLSTGNCYVSGIEEKIRCKKNILEKLSNELEDAKNMNDNFVTETISLDLFGTKKETITCSLKEKRIKDIGSRINTVKGEIRRLTESLAPGREKAVNLAKQLTDWNPYDQNTSSTFFDAEWMFGVRDGFDLIIGNPPFGAKLSKTEKSLYRVLYPETQFKIDTYSLFVLRAMQLLCEDGMTSYILPNTLLDNYYEEQVRLKLLKDMTLYEVNDLNDKVFKGAVVHAMIMSFINQIRDNYNVRINTSSQLYDKPTVIPASYFLSQPQYMISLRTYESQDLMNKLSKDCKPLKDIVDIRQAIKSGNDKKYIINYKKDDNYKPILRGKDIERYVTKFHGLYLFYGKHLSCPRQSWIFEQPKILIREAGSKIVATLDEDNFYIMSSLYNAILIDKKFDLRYVLACINSHIFQFLMNKLTFEKTKGAFTKAKIYHYYDLPVKDTVSQQPIIEMVNELLHQKKIDPLANTIVLEKKLDLAVYKLYDLTYDEILIIDPETLITRKEYENNKIS